MARRCGHRWKMEHLEQTHPELEEMMNAVVWWDEAARHV